jgi:hypothetical protein
MMKLAARTLAPTRLTLVIALAAGSLPAFAAYSLREFTLAGSSSTALMGINDHGDMVGTAQEGDTSYGFIVRNGVTEKIFDQALGTTFVPWAISNTGAVAVNIYRGVDDPGRAYVYEDGSVTFIGDGLYVRGISPDGLHLTGTGPGGAFVYSRQDDTLRTVPGVTFLQDINSSGIAVGQAMSPGQWIGPNGGLGAVVDLANGAVTTYDFDGYEYGAYQTRIRGINDQGDIAGWAAETSEKHVSFHYSATGVLEKFWMPDAAITWAQGLNNDGVVVGYYFDSFDGGVSRAFIGTPIQAIPEPGTLWMALAGVFSLAVLAPTIRRRRLLSSLGSSTSL